MPNPQIKFIVDYKEDIKNCLNFLRWQANDKELDYRRMFLPPYLHFILQPSFSQKERTKIINAYTKNYFAYKQKKFEASVSQIKKDWLKVAARYYKLMAQIFPTQAWPQGNYRAIASIYSMFPRYIEDKIFFFPPEHQDPQHSLKVIAHEMTHFIFFAYLAKHYKLNEDSRLKGKKERYVWLVSEIFNFTLEDWSPYKKILHTGGNRQPYFGEMKLCQQMKKDWQKKQDIRWLLDKWLR